MVVRKFTCAKIRRFSNPQDFGKWHSKPPSSSIFKNKFLLKVLERKSSNYFSNFKENDMWFGL